MVTPCTGENCFPSLLHWSFLPTGADGSTVLCLSHHLKIGDERIKTCCQQMVSPYIYWYNKYRNSNSDIENDVRLPAVVGLFDCHFGVGDGFQVASGDSRQWDPSITPGKLELIVVL